MSAEETKTEEILKRVQAYDSGSVRRLLTYLGLAFWLCDSVLGLVLKTSLWHIFLLMVWIVLLGIVIWRDFNETNIYLNDVATLDALEKQHSSDISSGGENIASIDANDIHQKPKGDVMGSDK